jgi:tetratricopeptide (TPR) repeat protein
VSSSTTSATPTGPADQRRLLTEAIDLHRAGRLLEAERIYRRILQVEPGHADALHLLGLVAGQAGHADAAIDLIGQAIAANPGAPSYHANLAMLHEKEGRSADAGRAASRALDLDPSHAGALFCLANAQRAQDRYDQAVATYERAIAVAGNDAALWSNYGSTLQSLGRLEEAITALRRAVALSPGEPGLRSNLGSALLDAGDAQAAIDAFREVIRVDAAFAPAYTNLANALLQGGRAAEAVPVLRQGLDVHPGDRKALAFLAAAAHETGDDDTRAELLDFDRLLAGREWQDAPGYTDMEAFNAALVADVLRHHTLQWEPVSKSTRQGSQTGELRGADSAPIAVLEHMIRAAIEDYLAAIDPDSDHPFLATRPDDWTLTLWATVLDPGGHQAAHLHPTGWLSGVYYAAVPAAEPGAPEQAGWIEFGRPPDSFRLQRAPEIRRFEPRPGRMLLFPSYFYHQTLPFAGREPRVSIAFDVMPARPPAAVTATRALTAAELAAELERGEMLLGQMKHEEASALARRLVEAAPADPATHYLEARSAHALGRVEQARRCLELAVGLAPDNPRYHLDLGNCCQQLRLEELAVEHLETAALLDPNFVEPLLRLATVHSDRGRFEQACAAYARALGRDPASGAAHYGLALLKKYARGDEQIGQLRTLLQRPDLAPNDEAVLCFALARALDQTGELGEAMTYYHRGNRLKRGLIDFRVEAERENADRIIRAFPGALFEGRTGSGDPSELPVFVVGMPRSGTTLVEQVMASHPAVHGAGELNDLWRTLRGISAWLPPGRSLPEAVGDVDPEAWRQLGAAYVERIRRFDPEAQRIVDKLPFNYTLAGVIRLMLPQARIVHCVRDPRDTAVSCYLTAFQNDRGFTFDLAELGETYRHYWRLMDHWRAVLPGGLFEIRYEDLVADLETEARRLIAYLGLDWSDACLDFHANPRVVATASMTQVRQPLYGSSVGRWRRYAPYLDELLTALGDPGRYGRAWNDPKDCR